VTTYGQFCPVAQAAEILAERWTPLVVRELLMGSHRFNDLRRGVPLMSASLLSTRLKTLEASGVLERRQQGGQLEYHLTEAGEQLRPIIEMLGAWGYRYAHRDYSREEQDPSLLMWDVRRRVDLDEMPDARAVVRFEFARAPAAKRRWWLVLADGHADLCLQDPGHALDLSVKTDVFTLTDIWMGRQPLAAALRSGAIVLEGNRRHVGAFPRWFALSPFASLGVARPGARANGR